MKNRFAITALALAVVMLLSANSFAAVTITIINGDPAGVGFNDPTPVAPVGGNPGTTLGQQRLIVYQAVANVWGATLTSNVPITVYATWEALSCTATSAVLGSAGATSIFRDFTGATKPGTWFSFALANKLYGTDLSPSTSAASGQIRARFNVNLGNTGCLTGSPFYLGLDNNHGTLIDFFTVLLHELGHGLGFQTFTNGSTGNYQSSFPSIWDWYLYDAGTGLYWNQETAAQRAASALLGNKLRWDGPIVKAAVPGVLQLGNPQLTVTAPATVAGSYLVGTASFGPVLSTPGVTGEVGQVVDTAPQSGLACNPLSAANIASVAGKIALVDRGVCSFTIKVKNCQNAGAIGVLVADNVAGSPPGGMSGTDPTIVIPSVRITLADGNTIKTALATRSRGRTGVFANLGVNMAVYAGADAQGRVLMYTPNPYASGSSVSHYDVSAFPNLLMEPNINGDLTHSVTTPQDLTFQLLQDTGWN